MAFDSVFDIIGPIIVGPSSSHTAGAARIGLAVYERLGKITGDVDVYLYNSFAKTHKGHGTDKAVAAGLLGFEIDDMRIKDALALAKEEGLNINFLLMEDATFQPNTVKICIGPDFELTGISIGGGVIQIMDKHGRCSECLLCHRRCYVNPTTTSKPGLFNTVEELLKICKEKNLKISELMIQQEIELDRYTPAEIIEQMKENLEVMEESIAIGIKGIASITGITGFDAQKMHDYIQKNDSIMGDSFAKAICYALATGEVNAAMGRVCVTPTAGASGVLPGVLFSLKERLDLSEEACLEFLFTAGAFGYIVANNAFIAGAKGGCQAEIGTASAMAAAGAVAVKGGNLKQIADAFSIALKNMLGLVCDPVAGLVEVPCILRNASGATNALTAAELALAGVKSAIPADEVISAMKEIGITMPESLRETAGGGLAITKTAKEIEKNLGFY